MKRITLLFVAVALLALGCSKTPVGPNNWKMGANGTPSEIEDPPPDGGAQPPPTVIMKWDNLTGPDTNGHYFVDILTTNNTHPMAWGVSAHVWCNNTAIIGADAIGIADYAQSIDPQLPGDEDVYELNAVRLDHNPPAAGSEEAWMRVRFIKQDLTKGGSLLFVDLMPGDLIYERPMLRLFPDNISPPIDYLVGGEEVTVQ